MGLLKQAGSAAGSKGKSEPARDEKKHEDGKKNVHKHVPKAASESVPEGADQDQDAASPQPGADEQEPPGDQDSDGPQPGSAGAVGGDGEDQDDSGQGDADGNESQAGGDQGGSPPNPNSEAEPSVDPQTGQPTPPGGDQETGKPGSPADDTGGGPAAGVDLSQIPIPPALKEEYQRANAALYTALYTNDNVAQSVLRGLQPQGSHKIDSVVSAAVVLFTQINKQLHFVKGAPQIVLPFTKDIVAHVLELGQQVKGIQYSDQEAEGALGSALEVIMRVVGVSKQQVNNLKSHIPRSQLMQGHQAYQSAVQRAQSIKQQAASNAGPPGAVTLAPGSAAPAPGGGGGPPQGAQPQPPGGGMLSQAAGAQEEPPAQGGGEEE